MENPEETLVQDLFQRSRSRNGPVSPKGYPQITQMTQMENPEEAVHAGSLPTLPEQK